MQTQTCLNGGSAEAPDQEKPWKGICCKACWFAKGPRCTCRCHRANHGHGRQTEKLDEIKNNKDIMSKLRWDLTPQTASISSTGSYEISNQAGMDRLKTLLAEKAGYYFYVDVWNCQARLALMQNLPDGGGKSKIITDFDSPLLANAVEEAGGWINQSGWYPLSGRLIKMLKKKLGLET